MFLQRFQNQHGPLVGHPRDDSLDQGVQFGVGLVGRVPVRKSGLDFFPCHTSLSLR